MLPAFGLYTHIRANRIRSVLLIGGLFLNIYFLVFGIALVIEGVSHNYAFSTLMRLAWFDLVSALPWVTAACPAWVAIGYFFNQSLVGMATGATELTRADSPDLYNMLENLCISRGLSMPKFMLMEDSAPNAFASGLKESQYSITLTRGLIDTLDYDEIEAVVAHELTHIRNEDVRMMVFAMVISGIVAFVCEMMFRNWFNVPSFGRGSSSKSNDKDSENGSGGGMIAIILGMIIIAFAWFLSQTIKLALSRSREYLADAGAVELTKNPDAMISALQKISGKGELNNVPSGIMELCLDNPRDGIVDMFATHPSIESRIDALVRFGGGRVVEQAPAPDVLPEQEPAPQNTPAPSGAPRRGPWGPLGGTGPGGLPL